ncbi:hypothetical protein [Aquimarina rhabdastrellae]
MRYLSFIFLIVFCFSCARHKEEHVVISKEHTSAIEKKSYAKKDAYSLLIKKKLQHYIDEQKLTLTHPEFSETALPSLFNIDTSAIVVVKNVELIPLSKNIDSVQTFMSKVIFSTSAKQFTDSIITTIKKKVIMIDDTLQTSTKFSFSSIKRERPKKMPLETAMLKPTKVVRFSLKDLSFTWDEIDACDCLFAVTPGAGYIRQLYFGRYKNGKSAVLQIEKGTSKTQVPILRPRSQQRTSGDSWTEIYANDTYKITLKASPAKNLVKGKFTYYIDFKLLNKDSRKTIRDMVLVNCKS